MSPRLATSVLAVALTLCVSAPALGAARRPAPAGQTKQQAERAALLTATRVFKRGVVSAMTDRGSGLLRDNVQISCRPAASAAGATRGRRRAFVCVLETGTGRRVSFAYRVASKRQARLCCLRRAARHRRSAPHRTRRPAISGTATVEQTLHASPGGWKSRPESIAYQWQRCSVAAAACVPIAGATQATYAPAAADAGARLRVTVMASSSRATTIATSLPTAEVAAAPDAALVPDQAAAPPPDSAAPPWFTGDLETGDLSQWPYLGDAHGVSVVPGPPGAPSRFIGRAVTTNGPDSSTGGDASYLETNSFGLPWENDGADAWFHIQVLLPSGHDLAYPGTFTPNPTSSGWNMFMEWHVSPGDGPASPYVGLWNDGNGTARLLLRLAGGNPHAAKMVWIKDPVAVRYDHWYDIAVRMKWSPDPNVGYVEWWVDGTQKFAGSFPTLYRRPNGSASSVLLDVGHYRGTQPWIDTVYFDGVRVGPTAASTSRAKRSGT